MKPDLRPINDIFTLPPGQQEVLWTILRHRWRTGGNPTIREVRDALGMQSPNGVLQHLKALQKKGFLRRAPASARAIELLVEGGDLFFPSFFGAGELFALVVDGEKHRDWHILNGDYLVLQERPTAIEGQLYAEALPSPGRFELRKCEVPFVELREGNYASGVVVGVIRRLASTRAR